MAPPLQCGLVDILERVQGGPEAHQAAHQCRGRQRAARLSFVAAEPRNRLDQLPHRLVGLELQQLVQHHRRQLHQRQPTRDSLAIFMVPALDLEADFFQEKEPLHQPS